MRTDRPMSEYESALFSAIVALGQTLLESGIVSETTLLAKLSESRSDFDLMESKNGAATLDMLIELLGEPPTYYVPGEPPG